MLFFSLLCSVEQLIGAVGPGDSHMIWPALWLLASVSASTDDLISELDFAVLHRTNNCDNK